VALQRDRALATDIRAATEPADPMRPPAAGLGRDGRDVGTTAADVRPVRRDGGEEPSSVRRRDRARGEVAQRTQPFRDGRAEYHRGKARAFAAAARAAERARRAHLRSALDAAHHVTEYHSAAASAAKRSEQWHTERAGGQRSRFLDAAHCGDGVISVSCPCGSSRLSPLGCGIVRLCVPCRDKRAHKRRAVLWSARGSALAELEAAGKLAANRRGGRWTEKHLVLTQPDTRIDGVARRVRTIYDAWRPFSRRLMRYMRGLGDGSIFYSRQFEWTPGRDGLGHPHFHCWLLSPYLPRELAWQWWSDSLSGVGVETRPTDSLIWLGDATLRRVVREVHKGGQSIKIVRLAQSTPGAAHPISYVEGWAVAERGKHGEPSASLSTQAALYCALEGRRQAQTSRGLMSRGTEPARCPACDEAALSAEVTPWHDARAPALHKHIIDCLGDAKSFRR